MTSATCRPDNLSARTTNALRTMESLERYRGHFYNWYDTQTRLPLAPLYVSTVDSGNLAGHLLTLRPGLTALCDAADPQPTMDRGHARHVFDSDRRHRQRSGRCRYATRTVRIRARIGGGSEAGHAGRRVGQARATWLQAPPMSPRISPQTCVPASTSSESEATFWARSARAAMRGVA